MTNYIVALTGGVGSGKSTVSHFFQEFKVPVFDADIISREIVKPGTAFHFRIATRFGPDIVNPDETLNRAILREKIFLSPADKKWIEALLHPPIIQELFNQATAAKGPYGIVVIPLLTELLNQSEEWSPRLRPKIQRILVVDASTALQKQRLSERDSISTPMIDAMIHAQANRIERLQIADDIITNTGDITYLKSQVEQLHQQYLRFAKSYLKPTLTVQ